MNRFCQAHGAYQDNLKFCLECTKDVRPSVFKWRCSGYQGCGKEIELGGKGIFCFSRTFPNRVDIYHEDCFENMGDIMKKYLREDCYRIDIHERPAA